MLMHSHFKLRFANYRFPKSKDRLDHFANCTCWAPRGARFCEISPWAPILRVDDRERLGGNWDKQWCPFKAYFLGTGSSVQTCPKHSLPHTEYSLGESRALTTNQFTARGRNPDPVPQNVAPRKHEELLSQHNLLSSK